MLRNCRSGRAPALGGVAAPFGTKQPQNPWILPGDSRGNLLTHLTRTNTPHRCKRELGGPRDPGNGRTNCSSRGPPTPRSPTRFGCTEPLSGRDAESPGGGRAGKTWEQLGGDTNNPGGPLEGTMRTVQRGHGDSSGLRWEHGDSPGGGRGGTKSLGEALREASGRDQKGRHSLPSPPSQPPARDPRYLMPVRGLFKRPRGSAGRAQATPPRALQSSRGRDVMGTGS